MVLEARTNTAEINQSDLKQSIREILRLIGTDLPSRRDLEQYYPPEYLFLGDPAVELGILQDS